MLGRIQRRRERKRQAVRLHEAIVAQSRMPAFYADMGVPDTMLGRYEMVCLHAYLVLTRVRRESKDCARLAQTLHDMIFDDFDVALREAGLGDMGIGHRIKKLARNLHGRISVYESGLAAGDDEMADILRRNMYASAEPAASEVARMIAYIRAARREIDGTENQVFMTGVPSFPDPVAFVSPPAEAAVQ
jgi:cytochrome b pre-mRNA-processing protein 3